MPTAMPPQPPPEFDPVAAFPQFAPLRVAVVDQDWPAVDAFFGHLTDATAYGFAAQIVADTDGAEVFLERAAADAPDSVLGRLLLGKRLVQVGWGIRSDSRANRVSRVQFAAFHEHLRRAEQLLIDVTAREPHGAVGWTARLPTAMGLELGQAEARRRYDHAVRHHPHHLSAQAALLQQLCPKWGGSWEEMRAFARDCMLAAPEGALNGVLVAEGHLERWLDLGRGEKGAAYLREPQVQQEIMTAAARSVLHPDCRSGPAWPIAHGAFALIHSLVGNYPAAAHHFRALGQFATRFPWSYAGDPATVFQQYRATALARG